MVSKIFTIFKGLTKDNISRKWKVCSGQKIFIALKLLDFSRCSALKLTNIP